jgi:hypothetical protein
MHNTAENGTSKPRPCFDDDATKNKDRRRRSEKAIEHTGFTVSAFVNDLKREVSRITSEANHESIASRIMCHDTRPLSFVRPSVVPIITTNPNDHPSQQLSCRRLIFYRVVSFSFADSTLSRARLYSPSVSIILLASLTTPNNDLSSLPHCIDRPQSSLPRTNPPRPYTVACVGTQDR